MTTNDDLMTNNAQNDARFLDLLQRWQSGDFSRADEQELNALAASDDFRREALEGFMSLPEAEHEERLAALRLRLNQRVGGGRLVTMPQIWAVAAGLVLLVAAIFLFQKWNEKQDNIVAQTKIESAENLPSAEPASPTETLENEDFAATSPSSQPAPPASSPAKPAADDQALSGPGLSAASEDAAPTLQEEIVLSDEVSSSPAVSARPSPAVSAPSSQGEVSDKARAEAEKEYAATSRAKRNSETAKAKAQKAESAARTADSIWHETDLKPDMAAEKKAARDEAQPKESEPANGWDEFREFLRQNARLTPEARNRNVSGTVRLQFNVNENGVPQQFIVLRSVGYGCDQEAIRLVQGWEWVRGQNPVVTLDVPFVR
jgi:TonB family protein